MGMASEIATESTIEQIVKHIDKALYLDQTPEGQAALKSVGLFALTCFDWSTPEWAKEYRVKFGGKE